MLIRQISLAGQGTWKEGLRKEIYKRYLGIHNSTVKYFHGSTKIFPSVKILQYNTHNYTSI